MSLVLDASLTMAWYFDDESTPATDALLDRVADASAVAPTVWRLEVANAFQTAIRRKRIDAAYRDAALAELVLLAIAIDKVRIPRLRALKCGQLLHSASCIGVPRKCYLTVNIYHVQHNSLNNRMCSVRRVQLVPCRL